MESIRDPALVRLTLKPDQESVGYVDGAWWPRSRDLAAELPLLTRGLDDRLGGVSRVSFAISAWEPFPRRIMVDGHVVRLGGFLSQPDHLLDVFGLDQQRLTLLVIPPELNEHAAQLSLSRAAEQNNRESPETILGTMSPQAASTDRKTDGERIMPTCG